MTVDVVTYQNHHLFDDNPIWKQAVIRREMCIDVLQWPGRTTVDGGKQNAPAEFDSYDSPECNPVYLIARWDGEIVGVNRMLCTGTGRWMIKDLWSHMVKDVDYIPQSPKVWEQSRFCFLPSFAPGSKERAMVVAELCCATQDFLEAVGGTEVWFMAWPESVDRMLPNREWLGPEINVDGVMCRVGRNEATKVADPLVRKKLGLPKSVLNWKGENSRVAA